MEWQVGFSEIADLAPRYEEKMAKGQPVPKIYEERPVISDLDTFFLRAFWRLRRGLEGLVYIPWRDAKAYAEDCRYPYPEDFHFFVEAMDNAYVKAQQKRLDARKDG